MKIRIHAEPEEIQAFVKLLEHLEQEEVLSILTKSDPYSDRGISKLCRVYIDLKLLKDISTCKCCDCKSENEFMLKSTIKDMEIKLAEIETYYKHFKSKCLTLEQQVAELEKINDKLGTDLCNADDICSYLQQQLAESEEAIKYLKGIKRYDIGEMLTENTKLKQQLAEKEKEIKKLQSASFIKKVISQERIKTSDLIKSHAIASWEISKTVRGYEIPDFIFEQAKKGELFEEEQS